VASQYEAKEWQKTMVKYVTSQLQARRDVFGIPLPDEPPADKFRLLDYACGTGVVSRALGPYVSQILGIDLSANMVATYNENAQSSGIPREVTHAVHGNLLDEKPYLVKEDGERTDDQSFLRDPGFNDFDAVIVGLGFHHFENFTRCLKKLSERVKPGGRVGIVDLFPKEGVSSKPHHAHSSPPQTSSCWFAWLFPAHQCRHQQAQSQGTATQQNPTTDGRHSCHYQQHLGNLPEPMMGIMHVSGFTEEDMKKYMEEAGLVDVQFLALPDKVYMEIQGQETDRSMFFASGRRPQGV
jgi:SAM-dependent methyltransferase